MNLGNVRHERNSQSIPLGRTRGETGMQTLYEMGSVDRPATGGYALLLGERQPMLSQQAGERGAILQVPYLRFG